VLVFLYREDIPEILAASDVCVDASYAGLGITGTLREALAVETAVIGTELEGNPELITDGETGYLFPPRDTEALARCILRMIADPDRGSAMARTGRKRVEEEFSVTAKLDRTEALYRRLLAAKRPA
jgi:glycosyltransferase involved in cell wall biosynthesis